MIAPLLRRYDTKKPVDEISLNFPELFIIGKYVKITFKNRGSPFGLIVFDQTYYKIRTIETAFVYILGFIFYDVSRAKTDLHDKHMI